MWHSHQKSLDTPLLPHLGHDQSRDENPPTVLMRFICTEPSSKSSSRSVFWKVLFSFEDTWAPIAARSLYLHGVSYFLCAWGGCRTHVSNITTSLAPPCFASTLISYFNVSGSFFFTNSESSCKSSTTCCVWVVVLSEDCGSYSVHLSWPWGDNHNQIDMGSHIE